MLLCPDLTMEVELLGNLLFKITRSKVCYDKLPTGISRWSGDTVRVSNSFQPLRNHPTRGANLRYSFHFRPLKHKFIGILQEP